MEAQPVAHPSEYILEAFDAGKLDDAGGQAVRAHLEACPACRTRQQLRAGRHGAAAAADAVSLGDTRGGNAVPEANGAAVVVPTTLFNVPPELADHPDYELLGELGRGGMGVVYLAKHRLSGRREVLKVMSKALIGQADSRERFLREIQSAARLDHKNVVKMYTAQERGELMVLVMEYVPGEDLAQVVKSRGPLPVLNACYYVQQAAMGLQHAFETGMIHRDIKPQNLILARQGKKHTVKVLDFGLAKATRGEDVDTGLTGTGVLMGTPGYVAPEQILDAAKADIRADIYSLGCTLYHLLAGTPPFSGKSLFEILQAHQSVEARPLNLIRAEVPEALASVVGKMMAKNAAQRYQTPMEVVRALEPFVKGVLKPLPPQPAPPQAEQPVAAPPPVIQATRIEGPATIARGRMKPSPRKPLPPKGRQQPGRPQAIPETMIEGDGTIARALNTADAKKSKTWLMVPLVVVLLLVGLVGLIIALASREHSPSTKATSSPGWPFRPQSEKHWPDKDKKPATETAESRLVAKVKEVAGIDLTPIPAGEFYMGSEKGDTDAFDDEKPRHKVRISSPFWLGKYKVTVGQFKRFVGATDYVTEAEKDKDKWTWRKPGFLDTSFDQTDEHPVVCVSWNDAKAYCAWLSEKTGAKVRLPREAEWEYSCRARSTTKDWATTKYYFGDNAANLGDYAWYDDNTKPLGTRPCGQKKPNAFGLYDMHGLAWEWCDDGRRTYSDDAESDPVGAGASRVIRGGSFGFVPRYCRAAYRSAIFVPSYRDVFIGFRVFVSR